MNDQIPHEEIIRRTAMFSECKKMVDHLVDSKLMDNMDKLNFYMNLYVMTCLELGVPQKEFAKINKMAYDLHLSLYND